VEKSDYLTAGKVIGAHGIAGTVRVYSYMESPDFFKSGETIQLVDKKGNPSIFKINWARSHGKVVLISFKGIEDRARAQELTNAELRLKRSLLPKLETGTYYWFDLIGMQVINDNNEFLGQIDSVIQTGSNDVYVVKNIEEEKEYEILVPAVESVITSVDIEKKILRVALPEGL
jgi:16S rRNA processing protein RimM